MTPSAAHKQRLYFAIMVLGGFTADAAEIQLKQELHTGETLVSLGEVAEITGASDDVHALASLVLFPAPPRGRDRQLRAAEVHEFLRLYGFDPLEHRITGAAATTIRVHNTAPSPDDSRAPATDKIIPTRKIVVAARALNAGEPIGAVDVKLVETKGTTKSINSVDAIADVVGQVPLRPIRADQEIDRSDLQRPLLIRRNETITVFSRSAGVEVRTEAKALEDGGLGDIVMLESPVNRQRYSARVSGLQQAEVYASGSTVARDITYTRQKKTVGRPANVRVTRHLSDSAFPRR